MIEEPAVHAPFSPNGYPASDAGINPNGPLCLRWAGGYGGVIEKVVELNRYAVGGGAFQAVVDPEELR
jgi:hypothetical protein